MAGHHEDSDYEDNFAPPLDTKPPKERQPDRPKTPSTQSDRYGDPEDAREAALRRELDGVRTINELIEGVVGTLERAQGNMQTVSTTVSTASKFLSTWTRILSQTQHTQRLILDPSWNGGTQDLQDHLDAEREAAAKAAAARRKAAEEERKRDEVRRQAEEQQRLREAGASSSSTVGTARGRVSTRGLRGTTRTGLRGRGIGIARGASATGTTSSSSTSTTPSNLPSARGTSKIGRSFLRAGSRGARGA